MAKVTYTKMDPADPDHTEWDGRRFKVGEAVELDCRNQSHKDFVERAKLNPAFDVDGNRKDKKPDDDGKNGEPKTPEEYRAYATEWINKSTSARDLERRWSKEEDLRDKVGWGSDDQHLIDPIYQPKLENLKRADG